MVKVTKRNKPVVALLGLVLAAVTVSACGQTQAIYPDKRRGDTAPVWGERERDTVFGKGGIDLFGSRKKDAEPGGGIAVNTYLWRASLDTMGFMPLSSADPFGGVIITDWYSPPDSPDERFKATIFILDRDLRADGIRVGIFRQLRRNGGDWADAAVEGKTAAQLEDAILTRARQLRTASREQ